LPQAVAIIIAALIVAVAIRFEDVKDFTRELSYVIRLASVPDHIAARREFHRCPPLLDDATIVSFYGEQIQAELSPAGWRSVVDTLKQECDEPTPAEVREAERAERAEEWAKERAEGEARREERVREETAACEESGGLWFVYNDPSQYCIARDALNEIIAACEERGGEFDESERSLCSDGVGITTPGYITR
jgi:hypothetical protein